MKHIRKSPAATGLSRNSFEQSNHSAPESAINRIACNFTSLSIMTLIYFDVALLLVLIVAGVADGH
jgi:hypothetical protein